MTHLVRLADPAGATAFVCYVYPGVTKDRDAATRFASALVAARVARDQIHGCADAFWPSERESAALTRAARKGWTATVEQETTT